jgi:hypothetical protein
MGLFTRKTDPISERGKALTAQIASLEAQIKKLDQQIQEQPRQPRLRSAELPHAKAEAASQKKPPLREPIFEPVDHRRLQPANGEECTTPNHYNDLGVRKYDLAAAWRRLRSHLGGPSASNPKLVTYLAAGSIKGLRPLRYEKRVARNRFIALFIILVCLLWGIAAVFERTH